MDRSAWCQRTLDGVTVRRRSLLLPIRLHSIGLALGCLGDLLSRLLESTCAIRARALGRTGSRQDYDMPVLVFPERGQHSLDDVDGSEEVRLELVPHHCQGSL